MNEIALHRGSSPHLNTIDIFVDGQHLTEAVVRGIATIFRPTTTENEFSLTASLYPPLLVLRRILYQLEVPLSTHRLAHSF
jgi:hypothetical protein